MNVISDTPLLVGWTPFELRPPTPSLTVVVKGSFVPTPGGIAAFADEQVPPMGQVFEDDDPDGPARSDSDFALLKPRAECFVVGSAWAPGGRPVRELPVAFGIGSVTKAICVSGDRHWQAGIVSRASEAKPFVRMPLSLRRAYGGVGYADNPFGRGRDDGSDGRVYLPNVEAPGERATSPRARPPVARTGPLAAGDPRRLRHAGTYDRGWLAERWPYLPEDFGWDYFLAAPSDQRIDGFWRGDEEIVLSNLHPEHALIRTRLPGIAPRVFLDEVSGRFREVPLKLDTITVDSDAHRVLCVWRGLVEVSSADLAEVRHLYVTHEQGASAGHAQHRERMNALLRADADEEDAAEGEEPPEDDAPDASSSGEPESCDAPGDDAKPARDPGAGPDMEEEEEADDAERELEERMAALEAQLAALGVPTIDAGAEASPPSEPPDPAALIAALESSGVPVPDGLREALAELSAPPVEEQPAEDEAEVGASEPERDPSVRERVLAAARGGASLAGQDLSEGDLSELDLRGLDLRGAILKRVGLCRSNLSGAQLDGAVLAESELVKAVLAGASLAGADLTGVNAQRADLTDAILDDAVLDRARLVGARLTRSQGARLSAMEADLSGAVLDDARWPNADLEDAALERARFVGADLRDVVVEGCAATGSLWDGATIEGLRAEGLIAPRSSFRGVKGDGAFFERAQLAETSLALSDLNGADFTGADVEGGSLDGCGLRKARFEGARLRRASVVDSDLFEAALDAADLREVDLRRSNLFGAELWRAVTDGARTHLANLERTKLAV